MLHFLKEKNPIQHPPTYNFTPTPILVPMLDLLDICHWKSILIELVVVVIVAVAVVVVVSVSRV